MNRSLAVVDAVFGRLTVIAERQKGSTYILCRCACGVEKLIQVDNLVRGQQSCGCFVAIGNKQRSKHGLADSPIYHRWHGMVDRCYNSVGDNDKYYKDKGIVVCEFLREGPQNLLTILGPVDGKRKSIDRFPIHNGNYTCGQCDECKKNGWELNIRWATPLEQVLNRGEYNTPITAFGMTKMLSEWRDLSGIGWMTLHCRLKRGWDTERTLTTPDSKGNKYIPNKEEG